MRPRDANGGTEPFPRAFAPGGETSRLDIPGWPLAHYATLDSTNLEAKRRLARGESGKALILADSQSNGQCRHDRLWESAPGKGIWASFILPVSMPFARLPQATLVLAVAVHAGVEAACGVSLSIKWPNDLLANGRKCCGLLVEASLGTADGTPVPLVLGVGVNCGHTVEDFPPHLRENATSLSLLAKNGSVCRQPVLAAIAREIDRWFGLWQREGFSPIRQAWLAHTCTVGRTVGLPEGYGYATGVAEDIDEAGALIVTAGNGMVLHINSGEISLSGTGGTTTLPAGRENP